MVKSAALGAVVEDVAVAATAELAAPECLSSLEHPIAQAVGLEKPSGAVLDQARPRPRPNATFVKTFEDLAVDPRPHEHVRGKQAGRPGANDPYGAHTSQCGTGLARE